MRVWTIAVATWREAVRQPVSIIILCIAALITFLSQYVTFFQFDESAGHNVIRQMAVSQTLMCGIVIAIFSASAVLAEEVENLTILTLLAKPVRRHEVVLGKFAGILMAVLMAFLVMVAVSLVTVWWAEAPVPKTRANPALALRELPGLATGQGSLEAARAYADLTNVRRPGGHHHGPAPVRGIDRFLATGDVLLLVTGQSGQLVARAPLSVVRGRRAPSPGLATLVGSLLRFFPEARTGVLFEAFLLAFVHVMVMAAVAIAVSTRLPLVFNALFCAAFFVLGNVWPTLSRMWFGRVIHVLPNLENLGLTEALAVGIDRVPAGVWVRGALYGIVYTMLVLVVAVLLFRRREVA